MKFVAKVKLLATSFCIAAHALLLSAKSEEIVIKFVKLHEKYKQFAIQSKIRVELMTILSL